MKIVFTSVVWSYYRTVIAGYTYLFGNDPHSDG